MTMLPDAVRAYEQELLQKADALALGLKGLRVAAPERAAFDRYPEVRIPSRVAIYARSP